MRSTHARRDIAPLRKADGLEIKTRNFTVLHLKEVTLWQEVVPSLWVLPLKLAGVWPLWLWFRFCSDALTKDWSIKKNE